MSQENKEIQQEDTGIISETQVLESLTDNTAIEKRKNPEEEDTSFLKDVLSFLKDLAVCFLIFG